MIPWVFRTYKKKERKNFSAIKEFKSRQFLPNDLIKLRFKTCYNSINLMKSCFIISFIQD